MSAPVLPEVFGNYALGDFVEMVSPESINWLPQTAGWAWLGAAALIFLLRYCWLRIRLWYRNRYRREALARLNRLNTSSTPRNLLPELNKLLKLVAVTAYPRDKVARLSGKAWTEFLHLECPAPAFSEPQLKLLEIGSYQEVALDPPAVQNLLSASRQWIREHRGAGNA